MKRLLLLLMMASAVFADPPAMPAPSGKALVPRPILAILERSLDGKILAARAIDPMALLAPSRGVYLEGFGVVFQTQVNLVSNAVMSPFKAEYTKDELLKLREKKADRIGLLKEVMQEMMATSARDLKTLPPDEAIVVAVSIFYFSWENSAGAPTQVVMRAPRKALLDAQAGKAEALQSALLVKMY